MKRYLLPALVALFAFFLAIPESRPCSTFLLKREGRLIVEHNLDMPFDIPGVVVVNRKGVRKKGLSWDALTSPGTKPGSPVPAGGTEAAASVAWISRYGSITVNPLGRDFPDGGINEAGLVLNEMTLTATRYPEGGRIPKLFMIQWIQYVLDSFGTVGEVVDSLDLIALDGWGWHFFVADAKGDCASIAFLDGKAVVHRGESMPVAALCNTAYGKEIDINADLSGDVTGRFEDSTPEGNRAAVERCFAAFRKHAPAFLAGILIRGTDPQTVIDRIAAFPESTSPAEPARAEGSPTAPSSAGETAALETTLDRAIGEVMEKLHLPGLAVGVVKEGRTVYAKGFGTTELGAGIPVTADTLFHVASVSKSFVATAVLQLAEEGKFGLDDAVSSHLPWFRLDDARAGEITIRHLLTHRSGMPDVRDYGWDRPETDADALERYVRSLADRKMRSAPGERFRYSNMGYDLLGVLIAGVSGRTFEEAMKERILSPLGMKRSTFLDAGTDARVRATPHTLFPRPKVHPVYPYNRIHAPSSTLKSSAREMCRWIAANLRMGSLGKARILKVSSYDELWKPYADAGRGRSVGCGWFLDRYEGRRCVLHSGADEGFQAYVILFPEEGSGAVFLSNCTRFRMYHLKRAVLDALFEEGAEDGES